MNQIVVTDIKQLDISLRTPELLRFLECAVALYRLDGKRYTVNNKATTYVLDYGKVRGLRNITGIAAYTLTLRKNQKITQAQLAVNTGVPATAISQMENGVLGEVEQINPEYVNRVATYLGFSVSQAMKLGK